MSLRACRVSLIAKNMKPLAMFEVKEAELQLSRSGIYFQKQLQIPTNWLMVSIFLRRAAGAEYQIRGLSRYGYFPISTSVICCAM